MRKLYLIFLFIFKTLWPMAHTQTVISTVTLPRTLVSASEATLLTAMEEQTFKNYKLNEDFNEIPSKEAEKSNKNKLPKARFKIAKVFTNCTRDTFEMRVELNRSFHGLLYAKDFPHECRARGTSDMNITLKLPTSGCGVRVEPKSDGSMELSVRIMMQMEEKLRQSSDILKTVKCKLPINAMGMMLAGMDSRHLNKQNLRHGRMQAANFRSSKSKEQLNIPSDLSTFPPSSHTASQFINTHTSQQTPRVRIWLELGGPDGSGSVVVGQATTLTVRAIVPGTMGVRIVDCAALDGLGESTQQLLDERGCPIDEQMSNYPFVTTRYHTTTNTSNSSKHLLTQAKESYMKWKNPAYHIHTEKAIKQEITK